MDSASSSSPTAPPYEDGFNPAYSPPPPYEEFALPSLNTQHNEIESQNPLKRKTRKYVFRILLLLFISGLIIITILAITTDVFRGNGDSYTTKGYPDDKQYNPYD